jgi:hypothetical protein
MENLVFIVAAAIFVFIFWGPHNKSAEKKDDKKGGGKK